MINKLLTIIFILLITTNAYYTGFIDGRLKEKAKRKRKLNGDKNE